MKLLSISSLIAVLVLFFGISAPAVQDKEKIQLAILLDTSSSMDGLINQARARLWQIVTDLSRVKRNDSPAILEVALYEYGNNTIPAGEGYIRMITPLTTDLDRISEALFRLTTNGGEEYCGQAIDSAVKGLSWSGGSKDLRLIFIAGNEPFTQGTLGYAAAVRGAAGKGIIVNTVHCGGRSEGIEGMWKAGADLGQGKYINIDHNQTIDHIAAPQDDEILKLGRELNATYLGYGAAGEKSVRRQEAEDLNAASVSRETAVQRSAAKATGSYTNSGWDLVDAVESNRVNLDKVAGDELPPVMRPMSQSQRKAYVAGMQKKRNDIQRRISKLNDERRRYVEEERKKRPAERTLDAAITGTIREQAERKGFSMGR